MRTLHASAKNTLGGMHRIIPRSVETMKITGRVLASAPDAPGDVSVGTERASEGRSQFDAGACLRSKDRTVAALGFRLFLATLILIRLATYLASGDVDGSDAPFGSGNGACHRFGPGDGAAAGTCRRAYSETGDENAKTTSIRCGRLRRSSKAGGSNLLRPAHVQPGKEVAAFC